MLAEYGKLSLADVLAPAIEMADGYPVEQQHVDDDQAPARLAPEVAGVAPHPAPAPRRPAARRRRDLPPAGPRRDAAQARRGREAGARRRARTATTRSSRPTTASTRATSRRSSCAARRRSAASTRPRTSRSWKVQIEEPVKIDVQGHRRLQARLLDAGPRDAPGAEHPRGRGPEGDGLQQRALHPRDLPGDEPGVRRPRLLLRRPVLPAASRRTGLLSKEYAKDAREDDRLGEERPERRSRAIRIRSRREKNPYSDLLAKWPPPPKPKPAAASRPTATIRRACPSDAAHLRGGLLRRHDVGRGGGRRGLGRLRHAVGRLAPGGHRGQDGHRHEPAHAELRRSTRRRARSTSWSRASARA